MINKCEVFVNNERCQKEGNKEIDYVEKGHVCSEHYYDVVHYIQYVKNIINEKGPLKVLDLFSGTQSFRKALDGMGIKYEYKGVDIFSPEEKNIILDLTQDDIVKKLKEKLGKWKPNFIWASPDCRTWSIAAISHHWRIIDGKRIPISERAKLGVKMVENTKKIIEYYGVDFAIENPRGTLRKHPIFKNYHLDTAMYCKYGDTRMKPTDIWSSKKLHLLKCKNGNSCHVSAPRGAKTGTQGLSIVDRSKVPSMLIVSIINQIFVNSWSELPEEEE